MKRTALAAALALACAPVFAGCIAGPWVSTNKDLHLLGSALVTGTVEVATGSVWAGVAAGVAVGAVREVWKVRHGYSCEYASMTYDLAGIALGAYGGHLVLRRNFIGFQTEF